MIELILLGMLYDGQAMTSYAIRKHMTQSTEFFQSNSLGSIQPGLKKLEKQGYLVSEARVENGRMKHYYRITSSGRAYCDVESRKDFGPDKIKCNQLVKMFFFDKLTPDERLESTERYLGEIRRVQSELIAVEAQIKAFMASGTIPPEHCSGLIFQKDTLQFGLDYYRFMEAWFTQYKTTLKDREMEVSPCK